MIIQLKPNAQTNCLMKPSASRQPIRTNIANYILIRQNGNKSVLLGWVSICEGEIWYGSTCKDRTNSIAILSLRNRCVFAAEVVIGADRISFPYPCTQGASSYLIGKHDCFDFKHMHPVEPLLVCEQHAYIMYKIWKRKSRNAQTKYLHEKLWLRAKHITQFVNLQKWVRVNAAHDCRHVIMFVKELYCTTCWVSEWFTISVKLKVSFVFVFEKTHLVFSPWPSFVGYCHRSSNTLILFVKLSAHQSFQPLLLFLKPSYIHYDASR